MYKYAGGRVRHIRDLKPDTPPGLEVMKLEFILRLKIKRNDWLIADTQPIIITVELGIFVT